MTYATNVGSPKVVGNFLFSFCPYRLTHFLVLFFSPFPIFALSLRGLFLCFLLQSAVISQYVICLSVCLSVYPSARL